MNTLILTVGLPRAGKSTWARKQGHPIVNPDSIRLALHGQRFVPEAEPMVWAITRYMVEALFLAGHTTVILDATSITARRRGEWVSDKWNVDRVVFLTSLAECLNRAKMEGREDLVPVIRRMHRDWERDGVYRLDPDDTVYSLFD